MTILLRLLTFVRRYWWLLLLAFICMMASTAFVLIIPLLISRSIDTVLGDGQTRDLIWLAIAVVAAGALRGLSAFGNSYLSEVVSQRTAYDIRNALYDKLQRLSFAFHDQAQTGELMSRGTSDVEAIRMFFGRGLLGLLQIGILFIAISIILVRLNWPLALLTMGFLAAVGWRAVVVARLLRPIWLHIQQLMAKLGTILEENLTGVRTVRSFAHEQEESRKFSHQAEVLYDKHMLATRKRAFNISLMVFLVTIPIALILWYGGREVIAGNLTLGELTQFVFYLTMMSMPVRRLGFITNIVTRTISGGQRILEILDTESAVKEKPGAIELDGVNAAVSFENVTFSYDSTAPVLKNVTFSVQQGELVALVGSLGSGKSTIAHLIPRFYDVSGGRITIDGIDVRDVTLDSLRRNVGIVQQDTFLFSATIRDNIAYGAVDADMEQVVAAAKAAQLHDFVASLSAGYETWVGERGVTLSGGQKQRLAIARTLLINPRILIMDDSTSSVDAGTEHLIRRALGELIKGRTTFIITHRLPIIRNADLILVLEEGEVVERGTHNDLMARDGLYRQIYESQLSVADISGEEGPEANDNQVM
ncbi:MAG: ABC transporter ATP-binding protein [Dehalococcoidia bacterium]|nr:ABC transporter ATP-binding protein [Dehalococcoidia bacterium]